MRAHLVLRPFSEAGCSPAPPGRHLLCRNLEHVCSDLHTVVRKLSSYLQLLRKVGGQCWPEPQMQAGSPQSVELSGQPSSCHIGAPAGPGSSAGVASLTYPGLRLPAMPICESRPVVESMASLCLLDPAVAAACLSWGDAASWLPCLHRVLHACLLALSLPAAGAACARLPALLPVLGACSAARRVCEERR